MANTLLAERTYKLLREFFLDLDSRNTNNYWANEIALANHSNIFVDKHMRNSTAENKLFVLMVDCMEDIRQASAKANGIKSIDKIMNKTCKENASRFGVQSGIIGGYKKDGCTYVTNSYYALKTCKDVSVPPIPDNSKFPIGVIETIRDAKQFNTEFAPCPTLSAVRSFIKLKKAEQVKGTAIYYPFIENPQYPVWVDAEYLARVIEFLGDDKFFCFVTNDTSKLPITPIYFYNEEGEEAVLCTVRKL